MRKVALTCICLLACAAVATAGMNVGALATYQNASDGDAGMGVGVLKQFDISGETGNTFMQARVSYLTGFGENDVDVTAIPIEAAFGFLSDQGNGLSIYGMGILGYYMMDVDADNMTGGFRVNGQVIASWTTSLDIDDAIGFALVGGVEKKLSDTVDLFAEIRYQILETDIEATTTGSGTTSWGGITVTATGGSSTEEVDLGGVGISAGARIAL